MQKYHFYIYCLLNHQTHLCGQVIFIWKRSTCAMAQEHSQKKHSGCFLSRCLCLNLQEFTLFSCKNAPLQPPFSCLPLSNGTWNKKRKRSSCKLQSGSADWLSSFAEREMLCSPMSFPPAGKKLPSTRSVSPSVPLIRRKCENLAHLKQEIVQYLGEKKEVFCWASEMFQESWIVLHSRAFIVQSSIKN